jgi:uncharacterized lipoprotein NlpE involved in copper resistance/surface antigen
MHGIEPPLIRRTPVYPHRQTLWIWLFGALLLVVQDPPVSAQTGLTLQNSPFSQFGDSDYKQFFAAVGEAADGPVGGPAIDWTNAASGAHGNVQSVRAVPRPEGDCRELQGSNTTRSHSEPFRVLFCKDAKGEWRLLSTLPRSKAAPAAVAAAPAPAGMGFPTVLPASFSGVLPCADCPGLQYHIEFHDDGSYRMRMTYLERGANGAGKDVDDAGAWQLVLDGRRVTLRSDANNTNTTFEVVGPDTLRLLDKSGQEISSKLNYDLKRAAQYAPIEPAH